jgi:type II secretory pathway pseudopilin PulG
MSSDEGGAGYALIESIVALAIVAVVIGGALETVKATVAASEAASEYRLAAAYAEELLSRFVLEAHSQSQAPVTEEVTGVMAAAQRNLTWVVTTTPHLVTACREVVVEVNGFRRVGRLGTLVCRRS